MEVWILFLIGGAFMLGMSAMERICASLQVDIETGDNAHADGDWVKALNRARRRRAIRNFKKTLEEPPCK